MKNILQVVSIIPVDIVKSLPYSKAVAKLVPAETNEWSPIVPATKGD